METSRDSYLRMFELGLSKEKLFEFGIKEMILVDPKIAVLHWNELKRKFYGKEDMYIRSAGRQGSSSNVFIDFYAEQFEHKNIKIDPTNNYHPRRLLANFTDFSTRKIKNKILLKNYQISLYLVALKIHWRFVRHGTLSIFLKLWTPLLAMRPRGIMSPSSPTCCKIKSTRPLNAKSKTSTQFSKQKNGQINLQVIVAIQTSKTL